VVEVSDELGLDLIRNGREQHGLQEEDLLRSGSRLWIIEGSKFSCGKMKWWWRFVDLGGSVTREQNCDVGGFAQLQLNVYVFPNAALP
jgi:hypothetical protein